MKTDVKALILWASVGLAGVLCASCSNSKAKVIDDTFALNEEITILKDKIDSLTERRSISIWFGLSQYNEHGKLVSAFRAIKQGSRYYIAYQDDIVPVDEETYIYLKHAQEEGVWNAHIQDCECGLYHALHNTDN